MTRHITYRPPLDSVRVPLDVTGRIVEVPLQLVLPAVLGVDALQTLESRAVVLISGVSTLCCFSRRRSVDGGGLRAEQPLGPVLLHLSPMSDV